MDFKDTYCKYFDSFVKYCTLYLADTMTEVFKELAERLPQLSDCLEEEDNVK